MNAIVSYGAVRTPWGRLWCAHGGGGVVAVALGGDPVGKLAEEVESRHPGRLVHDPRAVSKLLDALLDFLMGRSESLDEWIPDTTGLTPFRARVYEATRRLPYGRRVAYRDLAKHLGGARLAHAVGAALARNPYRLVVPDHRVVLAGGEPGGYRAGRGWKARLLALEAGQTTLEWNTGVVRRV